MCMRYFEMDNVKVVVAYADAGITIEILYVILWTMYVFIFKSFSKLSQLIRKIYLIVSLYLLNHLFVKMEEKETFFLKKLCCVSLR